MAYVFSIIIFFTRNKTSYNNIYIIRNFLFYLDSIPSVWASFAWYIDGVFFITYCAFSARGFPAGCFSGISMGLPPFRRSFRICPEGRMAAAFPGTGLPAGFRGYARAGFLLRPRQKYHSFYQRMFRPFHSMKRLQQVES